MRCAVRAVATLADASVRWVGGETVGGWGSCWPAERGKLFRRSSERLYDIIYEMTQFGRHVLIGGVEQVHRSVWSVIVG